MNKAKKLLRCTPSELLTLSQALVLLPIVKIMLKKYGYKRTKEVLVRLSRKKAKIRPISPIIKIGQARSMANLVRVAAKHLPTELNCLPKSMVLWTMLRRSGVNVSMRIGVQYKEGNFLAHAWIEHSGKPLSDSGSELDKYATFDKLSF